MLPVETPAAYSEEEVTIDLRQYIALFLQWWWLIALATLLAGAVAFLVSRQMAPVYQASTTVLINEAPSISKTTDYTSIMTSERLAKTYSEMMVKRPVLESVIARLGLPMTFEDLKGAITVSPVRDTQLVSIQVESTNPNLAAAIANAVVVVFSDQIQDTQTSRFAASKESLQTQIADMEARIAETRGLLTQAKDSAEIDRLETRLSQYEAIYSNLTLSYEQVRLAEAQTLSNVVQVEQAVVPTSPVRPKTMQNTLLAAVVGAMLAVGGIFAYDALDDTVKNPEEVTKSLRLPILGVISHYEEADDEEVLITRAEPRSPVSESFRALRTNVQYASVDHPLRTLLVTSPAPGDGKTTIATNLAVVLAQSGRRVAVLDADLHRPRVHSVFRAETQPGLSALFVQPEIHLNGSLQPTVQDGLRVVAAGMIPPNPSELLGSNKMREIMAAVLEQSDMVILDTPPVLSVNDSVVLAPTVDGVLLVIRPGETKMTALKQAVEQLRYVGANLIGIVLNKANTKKGRYGYYYKHYYYDKYRYGSGKGKTAAGKTVVRVSEPQEVVEEQR